MIILCDCIPCERTASLFSHDELLHVYYARCFKHNVLLFDDVWGPRYSGLSRDEFIMALVMKS